MQSMLVLMLPSPLDLQQKTHKTETTLPRINHMNSFTSEGSYLDLVDVEKTASIAAVNPGATEARAVLPGPTSLKFVSGDCATNHKML